MQEKGARMDAPLDVQHDAVSGSQTVQRTLPPLEPSARDIPVAEWRSNDAA